MAESQGHFSGCLPFLVGVPNFISIRIKRFLFYRRVTFTIGDTTLEVSAGNVVVAPANTPHKYTNTGTEPLQMISFHPCSQVIQEDLE